MSLSNLYAPVETPDAGLALDVSPLTNALNAIYARRAQMQMHRDQLAAQKAQHDQANELGWAQLGEMNRFHTAQSQNFEDQRRLQQAQIDATSEQHKAQQEEKAKAQQAGATGEAQQFAQTPAAADPGAIAALRAHVQSQGMRPYDKPEQFNPGEGPRPEGIEGPIAAPGESGMEAPLTGARVNLDPQVALMRLAAQARARQENQEQLAAGVGDPEYARNLMSTAPAAGQREVSGVPLPDTGKAALESTKLTHGDNRAAMVASASATARGTTENRMMENQLLQAMEQTAKDSKLPELSERVAGFREVARTIASKAGGITDEAMIRKLGLLYNKGSFSDRDAAAMDPTGKLGLVERVKAAAGGTAVGVRMTPAIRAQFMNALGTLGHEADETGLREFNNKFAPAYLERPEYKDYANLVKSQARAKFGGFSWFNANKLGYEKAAAKGAGKSERKSKSAAVKGPAAAGVSIEDLANGFDN